MQSLSDSVLQSDFKSSASIGVAPTATELVAFLVEVIQQPSQSRRNSLHCDALTDIGVTSVLIPDIFRNWKHRGSSAGGLPRPLRGSDLLFSYSRVSSAASSVGTIRFWPRQYEYCCYSSSRRTYSTSRKSAFTSLVYLELIMSSSL